MEANRISWAQTAGMTLGIIGGGIILWICLTKDDLVFGLLALSGAAVGYLTGILVVPLSPNESERFGVYTKIISGFVTGYLLSKVDPVITLMLATDPATGAPRIAHPEAAARFLITLCSFLITLLTVFNVRAYWLGGSGGPTLSKTEPTGSNASSTPSTPAPKRSGG